MSNDWNMPRRAEVCAACQRAFDVGESFQTLLYAGPEGFERRDFCLSCPLPAEPTAIGSWRTRRPEPATPRSQSFDREAIYRFFERLEDAHTPEQVQLRFLLALTLWRRKALKLERTIPQGNREIWEFLTPKTDVVHRVAHPDIDESELERLSGQLEQLLAGAVVDAEMIPSESHREDLDD